MEKDLVMWKDSKLKAGEREQLYLETTDQRIRQAIAGQRNWHGIRQEAENGEKGVENPELKHEL